MPRGPARQPLAAGSRAITRVPAAGVDSSGEGAADRLDPVPHVGQTGARGARPRVEARAVVLDDAREVPGLVHEIDADHGCAGVLGGVLDRLQAAEVRRRLDVVAGSGPRRAAMTCTGTGLSTTACAQRGGEPALREQRRVDAAGQVHQGVDGVDGAPAPGAASMASARSGDLLGQGLARGAGSRRARPGAAGHRRGCRARAVGALRPAGRPAARATRAARRLEPTARRLAARAARAAERRAGRGPACLASPSNRRSSTVVSGRCTCSWTHQHAENLARRAVLRGTAGPPPRPRPGRSGLPRRARGWPRVARSLPVSAGRRRRARPATSRRRCPRPAPWPSATAAPRRHSCPTPSRRTGSARRTARSTPPCIVRDANASNLAWTGSNASATTAVASTERAHAAATRCDRSARHRPGRSRRTPAPRTS